MANSESVDALAIVRPPRWRKFRVAEIGKAIVSRGRA